ncbi:MAG: helix-turn-helix transcriptional regulator [Microbacteriaceae bacterium]|nr:helix-turn-helix transcriptional regulator [Microbacteriaceae bacterium]
MFGDKERPLYEIKANLFKGLAHPYRIKILEILSRSEEVSVAQMLKETGLEGSHLSQHLAVLRKHQLVTSERRASVVYYRLAYPEVADLLRVARQLLGELLGDTQSRLVGATELPNIPELPESVSK